MPLYRNREGGDICAIFVHAGAGYHSHQNEKIHLAAVNDAARVAMAVLKNGGEATDAVEMAIRLLEDREITNSGYGSNLTMDGHVECDASMVDHYGRSGAVGAVSQIKNPIALARIVLRESTKPLSLQRVPPNLLIGPGATQFAADFDMPILPHDYLISDSARDRWCKWKQDLVTLKAKEDERERQRSEARSIFETQNLPSHLPNYLTNLPTTPPGHHNAATSLSGVPTPRRPLVVSTADLPTTATTQQWQNPSPNPTLPLTPSPFSQNSADDQYSLDTDVGTDDNIQWMASLAKRQNLKRVYDGSSNDTELESRGTRSVDIPQDDGDDHITDTVGAIAIDSYGNIAAGSSSGGIGMKHAGRCGPAALVGVGTAVIPIDPQDPDRVCVATVTSGTGEHMATTAAAATAADRIYSSVRKENGKLIMCNEDEALNSMIKNDFMQHPGVTNSHCAGAIGILAVKKTRDAVFFYFGHNTDSFALASMHSEERKPVVTMSRSKGDASIAQGGRVSRSKYARRTQLI